MFLTLLTVVPELPDIHTEPHFAYKTVNTNHITSINIACFKPGATLDQLGNDWCVVEMLEREHFVVPCSMQALALCLGVDVASARKILDKWWQRIPVSQTIASTKELQRNHPGNNETAPTLLPGVWA